ncbi:CPBP family intramembrane glutamic endopeptidase [Mucilaginibacter sp. X5P1]|uniref:CPBP family intramembrane glutamic endopeptidase n=1 Tax=Mucilaginibacter sp. X5P1 TaxID=2723088 RepID=UPI00161442D8|nr:type II CAAX endopeptidase family protein [Mucilaginibacter sp. X5P1]MBB6139254.1 hypothetical protein [Mucilaginibacter sp. X5P1]
MINIPYKDLDESSKEMHPALQFLLVLAILLVALLIGTAIGLGIITGLYGYNTFTAITESNLNVPNAIPALWILQLTSTTLPILATPVFFAYVVVPVPQQYLKSNFRFPWVLMLLVFAIMFISSPLIEFLSNINAKMVLPHFLQWMRESEDNAEKLTNAMLHMDTIWQMIFDLLFIGLLTAIVEEYLFRGCIQTIIEKWTKNIHVAIWITAILFSAFHMEFFGFLPRMMLGVLFGYFVAWSGSIWTSVWGHFINNGTAVVITYLYQHKEISISPDDQHVFNSAGYIISFIIVLFLFWVYRDIALKKKPVQA